MFDLEKQHTPLPLLPLLRKPTAPKLTGPGGFVLLQVCEEEKADDKSHVAFIQLGGITEITAAGCVTHSHARFTSRRKRRVAAETKGGEAALYCGVSIIDICAHESSAGARTRTR